jgi:broad specificity phosphatase PhoE
MRWARGLIVAATLMSAAISAAGAQAAKSTTVILVRHAEKGDTPANDPPLTPAGEARARELWNAVKDAGVDAVITTQLTRTRATAAPTATALGLTPTIVPATSTNAKDVATAVRGLAGHTVLVVGHSNTVPAIIAALGAKEPAAICDSSYDNFYVVTIGPDGKAAVVHTRFGARTPDDEGCPKAMK